jgi:hypothetical protein
MSIRPSSPALVARAAQRGPPTDTLATRVSPPVEGAAVGVRIPEGFGLRRTTHLQAGSEAGTVVGAHLDHWRPGEWDMRRSRRLLATLIILSVLSVLLAVPAEAARPDPFISRLTATTRWITDSEGGRSYYVLWLDVYARNIRPQQYLVCAKALYADGTTIADQGGFPRVRAGTETVAWLQLLEVPDGAATLTVTAQLMRLGARGCCTPTGALRTVEASLPARPPAPPATSDPQVVFDISYPAP